MSPAEHERDGWVDQLGIGRGGEGKQFAESEKVILIGKVGRGVKLLDLHIVGFKQGGEPEEGGEGEGEGDKEKGREGEL